MHRRAGPRGWLPHRRHELRRQQRRGGADHASADVRRQTLARCRAVGRVHTGQVIAPEAELRDRHQADGEMPLDDRYGTPRCGEEHEGQQHEPAVSGRDEAAAAVDNRIARYAAESVRSSLRILERLHTADGLLHGGRGEGSVLRQDPGRCAASAESRRTRRVRARHHDGRPDGRASDCTWKQLAEARGASASRSASSPAMPETQGETDE